MVRFSAALQKYNQQAEKTGWTFVLVTAEIANKIKPGVRKSYRVKGRIDQHGINGVALMPIGDGAFILPVNGTMRRAIRKQKGDKVTVELEVDQMEQKISRDLLNCLADEPNAQQFFLSLPPSHQRYFSNWIESAKTSQTKSIRIANAVSGLALKLSFGEMLRMSKEKGER